MEIFAHFLFLGQLAFPWPGSPLTSYLFTWSKKSGCVYTMLHWPVWGTCTGGRPGPPSPCPQTPWSWHTRGRTCRSHHAAAGAGWGGAQHRQDCWGCPGRRWWSACVTATVGSGPGCPGNAAALLPLPASHHAPSTIDTQKILCTRCQKMMQYSFFKSPIMKLQTHKRCFIHNTR